jgi:DNA-nicking Smr family endonuclease
MTSRDRNRDGEGPSFADLIGKDPDVLRKQGERAAVNVTPGATRKRRPAGTSDAPAPPGAKEAQDDGTGVFRGDTPPAEFRELRSGQIRPGARVDLHRLDRAQARHTLRKAFGTASAQGVRCVLVIHGRGRRSPGGEATLKSALPGWLRSAPLDEWVRSFAPALPRDGGDGASYVLLRIARHPQSPRHPSSRRSSSRRGNTQR